MKSHRGCCLGVQGRLLLAGELGWIQKLSLQPLREGQGRSGARAGEAQVWWQEAEAVLV